MRGREICIAQAVVDVFAAQATNQRASQEQLLHRAVRTDQRTNAGGTMVCLDLLQAIGNVFKRCLPVDLAPLATLLEHRFGQAFGAVEGFVGETVAVGDPALVDVFVFQRHNPHDLVVLDLHHQVRAGRIVRADRLAPRQLPSAGAVTKWLARERAHRADVDHVAGQFGVDRLAQEGFDLRVFTTVRHAEFHHAGHLLAKTHATGAVDTAAHLLHGDQRTDILVGDDAFFFFVT